MEWKACREQHPGGMGDGVPHINNMSDQRIRFFIDFINKIHIIRFYCKYVKFLSFPHDFISRPKKLNNCSLGC